MDNIKLVDNIKRLCLERNVTVSQLERELFLSPGLISRWAKSTPSLDRILDVAEFLGVSVDDIISNTNGSDTGSRTTRQLIDKLYEQTVNSDLEWHVLDKYAAISPTFQLLELLESVENLNFYDIFFATFGNGYFSLLFQQGTAGILEIKLYALADLQSVPVRLDVQPDRLQQLYDLLRKRLFSEMNALKTNAFIERFLNSSGPDSPDDSQKKVLKISRVSKAANEY